MNKNEKSVNEKSVEEILGIADLPSDTCENCRKVFTDAEVNRYGKDEHPLCENCRKEAGM